MIAGSLCKSQLFLFRKVDEKPDNITNVIYVCEILFIQACGYQGGS